MKGMGFRIPPGLSSVFGTGSTNRGGGGYYGSRGYGGSSSGLGSMFGGGGAAGLMDNAGDIMKIAKMFMLKHRLTKAVGEGGPEEIVTLAMRWRTLE